ncbi:hypothetical protein HDU91_000343 [Kappamyces sp. JEL0680]|nr:hypothetical protein HDU91_000343 [Kappamyces sp. JEL0680]
MTAAANTPKDSAAQSDKRSAATEPLHEFMPPGDYLVDAAAGTEAMLAAYANKAGKLPLEKEAKKSQESRPANGRFISKEAMDEWISQGKSIDHI